MKAMVLCAGFGTRLGDLTREIPKPMLSLHGRPMLEYILCNLQRHGFDEIGLNLHFMPETIRDYFGDGAWCGLQIEYSYEPQLLGTAGGTKKMEAFLRGPAGRSEPFLVHYGDVVTNQDFSAMLDFHRQRNALATLLVHQRARSNSIVGINADGRIERFLERPTEDERDDAGHCPDFGHRAQRGRSKNGAVPFTATWVFSGIAICEPELFDVIPAGQFCDFPRDIFVRLAGSRKLFAFPLSGKRCAVDSPERLEEARRGVAAGDFRADFGQDNTLVAVQAPLEGLQKIAGFASVFR
jgi:NDP-sugar pyrophosphorylase family protein